MSHQLNQRELIIDLSQEDFKIKPIGPRIEGVHIIGPVDYGWARYLHRAKKTGRDDPDIMTWGGGPLAGSRIPGTRRLVFCGYSPQWEGFYISSFGGGAYIMHRIGVDFISIIGASKYDSVLILNHKHGEIHMRLEALTPEPIWNGYAGPQGEKLLGFYALQQAVFDRFSNEYDQDHVRIFAVGPAARLTNQGIIGSNQIRKGLITPIDDWAGRGGLGSRILQTHHVVACIFGGDWEDPDLKNSKEIDGYFRQYYGESMIKVDLGSTEKYRYTSGFQTGGTFGVNMHTADDRLFSFNYTSIYHSDANRLEQHKNFILQHYLHQFNKEIIEPKNFAHCGEPCSVACKKYYGLYKKDYEPYQSLGPQCGIFDQRAAEQLNHFIDSLGIDAIQIGGVISWLMELIHDGVVLPEDFNLPPASEMNFVFTSDPEAFDLVNDSARNAAYAQRIASMIIFDPQGDIFRQGLRTAARELDERYHLTRRGERTIDRVVFVAHGKQGSMIPNQYWVPGMLSPMPIMGKYFVYYGVDYLAPVVLGRRCVERMVYELYSENSGVCRFHRKWVEAIIDEIISAHYNFGVDYKAHQFELAKQIFEHQGGAVKFWDSERTIDVVCKYLDKWQLIGLEDKSLQKWVERFRIDKWVTANDYWQAIFSGIVNAFSAGAGDIPDIVAPYQAARQDVMEKVSHP